MNNRTSLGDLSYTWDANKNKTSETVTGVMSGYGFTSGGTTYDFEDRLTGYARASGTFNQSWNLTSVGDWTSVTTNGIAQNRTHGPTPELLTAGGSSVVTDVKGNMTSIPATLRPAGATTALLLSWDFDNKLASADIDANGTADVSFQYDALGRRVARTGTGGSFVFVQMDQQTIADYPVGGAASTPTYRYVYASYIDEPVVRKTAGTGGTLVYFHRNQQFSITAITNSTGAISERYAYTAYGQPTILDASGSILSASTISNRYTYTGREWDATLGLHHFRARWMSPSAGRFLGRDPIGYVDYHLLYAYVRGGALVALDPTGLVRIECKCACRYGRFSVANVETDCNEPPYLCCLRACQRHGEKCFYEGGGWRNVGDSLFNDDIPISNWPKWPYDLPSFGDPQPPRPPALMGYGHYCGPNRKASCIRKPDGSMIPGPGQPPPIDDMDLACMQHDCCLADAPQVLHAIACRSPCNVLFCRALDAFNCDALYYKDPIQRYWCERMKQKAQGLFCLPAGQ